MLALEVGWAIGLRYTLGFTRVWPSVFTPAARVLSVALFGEPSRAGRVAILSLVALKLATT